MDTTDLIEELHQMQHWAATLWNNTTKLIEELNTQKEAQSEGFLASFDDLTPEQLRRMAKAMLERESTVQAETPLDGPNQRPLEDQVPDPEPRNPAKQRSIEEASRERAAQCGVQVRTKVGPSGQTGGTASGWGKSGKVRAGSIREG